MPPAGTERKKSPPTTWHRLQLGRVQDRRCVGDDARAVVEHPARARVPGQDSPEQGAGAATDVNHGLARGGCQGRGDRLVPASEAALHQGLEHRPIGRAIVQVPEERAAVGARESRLAVPCYG